MTSGAPSPADRDLAIGAGIAAEAERLDWLGAWPPVVRTRADLLDAIAALSAAQAAWKPAAAEWSIEEVVRHALNASRDVLRVIEGLAAGNTEGRRTRAGEQPAQAPAAFDELRRQFIAHSIDFASVATRLPAAPHYELTAPHARFGQLNCRAWFLFQRVHDGDHTGQITQIKAATGFPAA